MGSAPSSSRMKSCPSGVVWNHQASREIPSRRRLAAKSSMFFESSSPNDRISSALDGGIGRATTNFVIADLLLGRNGDRIGVNVEPSGSVFARHASVRFGWLSSNLEGTRLLWRNRRFGPTRRGAGL